MSIQIINRSKVNTIKNLKSQGFVYHSTYYRQLANVELMEEVYSDHELIALKTVTKPRTLKQILRNSVGYVEVKFQIFKRLKG